MTVSEAVATRRAIRAFQDTPVDIDTLRRVMDKARFAPSGCNYQPWEATIVTGDPLKQLQERMRNSSPQDPPEYDWSAPGKMPDYQARLFEVSEGMYGAMGIAREDKTARREFFIRNVISFDAPAVLLCYFPRLMGPPQWSDVGMWLQTIMLLLREEGLDSCPQEYLWAFARLIKDFIGVSDETHIFFCGLAIGYRDADAPVNNFERQRVPLDDQVRFLGF
ncbi:MAG: nitroreductase [Sphingobium sp.]